MGKLTLNVENSNVDLFTSIPRKKITGTFGQEGFKVDGVPIKVNEKNLKDLKAGKLALDVTITYKKKSQHLTFIKAGLTLHEPDIDAKPRLNVISSDENPALLGPVFTSTGGRNVAYVLMNRKWVQDNPKIQLSLKDDSYLASTGMVKQNALNALTAATNVWDHASNKNLFIDSGVNLTNAPSWKYDGVNDMVFTPYAKGCSALAATGTWYKTQGIPAGQMYPIVEASITFNANLKWTATGETGKLDFQSVACHEFGHVLGLGDLYGRAQFLTDTIQMMHYYTGVKHVLGNGDTTGIWQLYG
jgi:hypothetical protein